MEPVTDCSGRPFPAYTTGKVTMCGTVEGAGPAGSVYRLVLALRGKTVAIPLAGQFYMLRALKSGVLLGRPVSVFHAEKTPYGVELQFLILEKGLGTTELCGLEADDQVQLLGPLGNTFPVPAAGTKVCIIGGGIGVAPVAGFAETLPDRSYDFYASFKSGTYGVKNIHPALLTVTTDDGSAGIHGMLPSAVDEKTLKKNNYSAVYACGPAPMLAYVQKIAASAGVQCWISMEARMACGMGVCLGCTIHTTEGNRRCCKDGPVFDARVLEFPKSEVSSAVKAAAAKLPLNRRPDLSVIIAGVKFRNPIIGSSGTFGFGTEYMSVFDVNRLGGIASKGLTLEPREGNSGIRLWETPAGLMNSIGLQNPGIPHFIEHELPEMLKLKPVTIANLSGSTLDTYIEGAKLLDKTGVPVIELNISCPNVAAGGASWGMTCDNADAAVRAVRAVTKKPLIVKLTPQAADVAEVAMVCRKAGADAISLCNSFQGVAIDIERGIPVFDKIKAGFGGPAVRPIAMRLVYEVAAEMNKLPEDERIPVIAIGGAAVWQDVVEYIMAGASAVEVGTNTFADPYTMTGMIDGLSAFMKRKGFASIEEMRGIAQK